MKEPVIPNPMPPLIPEESLLLLVELGRPQGIAAAGRLPMVEHAMGCPDIRPSALPQLQAKVDVIEINGQVLRVETADRLEFDALHGKTGSLAGMPS